MATETEKVIESHSPEETRALAASLASRLRAGDVVLLFGDLGTGKTLFVEAAVKAMGYGGRVRSPSFTLLNVYKLERFPVQHLDLYRWDPDVDAGEMDEWWDLFSQEAVTFVEWAERLPERPEWAIEVHLEHTGEAERLIRIRGRAELLQELAASEG